MSCVVLYFGPLIQSLFVCGITTLHICILNKVLTEAPTGDDKVFK